MRRASITHVQDCRAVLKLEYGVPTGDENQEAGKADKGYIPKGPVSLGVLILF